MDFFSEDTEFLPDQQEKLSQWIVKVIESEGKTPGAVSFIFCSDEYLLKMNIDHLQHDYYTDIITFDYCEGPVISGDLFISVDRVRENAADLSIAFEEELHRVMVHGVLHLLGHGDKTEPEQKAIRAREDGCLALL
ncbi:MAG: rRNA maturation RNase YbeY [Flavobacteriales bacterium]|nr:rRNA maturation RNase YbeY [Flavobacteriales bacterium]